MTISSDYRRVILHGADVGLCLSTTVIKHHYYYYKIFPTRLIDNMSAVLKFLFRENSFLSVHTTPDNIVGFISLGHGLNIALTAVHIFRHK